MKTNSKLNSVVSYLIIFIILIQQFGCSTSKVISTSDMKVSPEYLYKIHYKKTVYLLEEPVISNGILSGKFVNQESTRIESAIHIYPVSDSVVRINSQKIMSIPLDKISQIEEKDLAKGKTAALVIGSIVAVIFIIGAISLSQDGFGL
jgi:hypothetical protein